MLPLGRKDVNYIPGSTHSPGLHPLPPGSTHSLFSAGSCSGATFRDSARGEVTPLLDEVLRDIACAAGAVPGRGLRRRSRAPGRRVYEQGGRREKGPGGTGGGGGTREEPGGKVLSWGGVTKTRLTMERKQILEPKALAPAFSSSK